MPEISHFPLFFFVSLAFRALQEVDRTDEESADHRALRVVQRGEVHRRHKQGNDSLAAPSEVSEMAEAAPRLI